MKKIPDLIAGIFLYLRIFAKLAYIFKIWILE